MSLSLCNSFSIVRYKYVYVSLFLPFLAFNTWFIHVSVSLPLCYIYLIFAIFSNMKKVIRNINKLFHVTSSSAPTFVTNIYLSLCVYVFRCKQDIYINSGSKYVMLMTLSLLYVRCQHSGLVYPSMFYRVFSRDSLDKKIS